MGDITEWRPAEGDDLINSIHATGNQIEERGQSLLKTTGALGGDGLQGASADGLHELTQNVNTAITSTRETTDTVAGHVQTHGDQATSTDTKFNNLIVGG